MEMVRTHFSQWEYFHPLQWELDWVLSRKKKKKKDKSQKVVLYKLRNKVL